MKISKYILSLCIITLILAACGKQKKKDLHLQGSIAHNNNLVAGSIFSASWYFCGFCQLAKLRSDGIIQQGKIDTVIHDFDNRKYYFIIIPNDISIPISPIITFNCNNDFKQDVEIVPQIISLNAIIKSGDIIKNLVIINLIQPKDEKLHFEQNSLYKDSMYLQHALVKFDTLLIFSKSILFTHVKEHSRFKLYYNKNNKDTTFETITNNVNQLDLNL